MGFVSDIVVAVNTVNITEKFMTTEIIDQLNSEQFPFLIMIMICVHQLLCNDVVFNLQFQCYSNNLIKTLSTAQHNASNNLQ